jgi:hypothetical protein
MASIIGVQTLQHTNGTTAATIDSDGKFLPKMPAWNQVGIPNAPSGNSAIVWNSGNTGSFAKHGCTYNSSTGVVTVPVAGLYMVHFNLVCREQTSGNTITLQIEVSTDSGSTFDDATAASYSLLEQAEDASRWRTLSKTIVLDLDASNQIRIKNDSSETWEVPSDDNVGGNFSGYLIGAS